MKRIFAAIISNAPFITKGLMFLICLGGIVFLFPRQTHLVLEYQEGRQWLSPDLFAPLSYPVLKSEEALNQESEIIRQAHIPVYEPKEKPVQEWLDCFETKLDDQLEIIQQDPSLGSTFYALSSDSIREVYLSSARNWYKALNERSIPTPKEDGSSDKGIRIHKGGELKLVSPKDVASLKSVVQEILKRSDNAEKGWAWFYPALAQCINYNLVFSDSLDSLILGQTLDKLPRALSLVNEGDLVIQRGEMVNQDKARSLESLKMALAEETLIDKNWVWAFIGQILLIGTLLLMLAIFLYTNRKDMFHNNAVIAFILVNVFLMVLMAALFSQKNPTFLNIAPFCILPLVIRAFYDTRVALFMHMIAILIAGFFVPKGFEFVFVQLLAGIVATLTVVSIHKRSDLFMTALKIFLTYVAAGIGISLIQNANLDQKDATEIGLFAASAGLTLFAFPLVYLYEKMFGMVSDVSLLELSDTNSPLLRELNERAPGTFQHSLQVANLAEAAIQEIEGNTLLTRVGALYHDIGKMSNPQYFIENQSSQVNPHDELSFDESAKMIIDHVIRGVEIAKKYRLPDRVIDFIRTHHGTTTVQYFYRQYIKTFPEEMVDKDRFSYPGPKPFSRETAVLMMSDAVEAASRSLPEKTAENLAKLVDQIIDKQMDEGQFEQVNITFKDVELIKRVFKRKLRSIYHVRVAYPD